MSSETIEIKMAAVSAKRSMKGHDLHSLRFDAKKPSPFKLDNLYIMAFAKSQGLSASSAYLHCVLIGLFSFQRFVQVINYAGRK